MNRSPAAGKAVQVLSIIAAAAIATLCLWSTGVFDPWELKTWDWRIRAQAKKGAATEDVCLILVDQASLDWGKNEFGWSWPWPREVFAKIIDHCSRQGVKALALDLLFFEPSFYGVEDDRALGKSIADSGAAACAMFLRKHDGEKSDWPVDLTGWNFRIDGVGGWFQSHNPGGVQYPRASFPIPEVTRSAAILCNVHQNPDSDGVYRRIKLFNRFSGRDIPSLGLGALFASDPETPMKIVQDQFMAGGHKIPLDSEGNVILRYRGPSGTHRIYNAANIIRTEMEMLMGHAEAGAETADLKNKYVFIGLSAPGLMDLRSSPVGGAYPGAEIHATMLDNLLSDDFVRETGLFFLVGSVLASSAAGAISSFLFSSSVAIMLYGLILMGLPLAAGLGMYAAGFMIPIVASEASCIISILASLAVNYAVEGRQKRFIKSAFSQYLSPAVIEQLIQQPDRLKLGGERRLLTIFFSDLKGFTSISEGLEPEELTTLLNNYLTAMTDIIIEERGTVDKYEGDAIIAFWNAPTDIEDHCERCVRAALRCQRRLAELRPVFYDRIGKEMHMRIGVNTGPAVVGNFGSNMKFDYTMLGDSVNLAARLEGTGKEFGLFTLVSEFTRNEIKEKFAYREVARIVVMGRREAVTIFEPMFFEDYDSRKIVYRQFEKGLAHFYKGSFDDAVDCFKAIADDDPAAEAYIDKCRELMEKPVEGFDGAWVMTRK